MTARNVNSWLPYLLGPIALQTDGEEVDVPRRSTINLIGATVEDDPDEERTNITIVAEGGGAEPGGAEGELQTNSSGALGSTTGVTFDPTYVGPSLNPGQFFKFSATDGGFVCTANSRVPFQWSSAANEVRVGTFNYLRLYGALGIDLTGPIGGDREYLGPLCLRSAAITKSDATDLSIVGSTGADCPVLRISGTPGGAYNIIAPDQVGATYHLINDTASAATIKKSGGTGITIAANRSAKVWHNGTDYERLTLDAPLT